MKNILARLLLLVAFLAPVSALAISNPITTNPGSVATNRAGTPVATNNYTVGGATYNIGCLGDSLTTTVGSIKPTPYCPTVVASLLSNRSITAGYTIVGMVGYSWNYNYGSPYPDSVSTINLAAPYWVDTQIRPSQTNILVMWAGTNGMAPNLGNHSAATEYSDFQTDYNARIAAGWTDANIIVITTLPREDNATFYTRRATYNANLISWCAAHGCKIADAAADSNIGCDGCEDNTTYYQTDKIHLKTAGQNIVANLVYAQIAAVSLERYLASGAANDNFQWRKAS